MLVYHQIKARMTEPIMSIILLTSISLLIPAVAFICYTHYKNSKYVPARKWFIGSIEIIPKFAHLEPQMDALIIAPKFLNWLHNFDADQITLRSITITDIDWFAAKPDPVKLGFVKCASEAYDFKTGKKIVSNISFIRGDAVAILIIVKVIDPEIKKKNKEYVLLCEQHRLPIGKKAKEIAAGMMDADGNIISVALKEVKEETDFNISHVDDLQSLGSYYASPGGSDEEIYLFAWRTVVSATDFEKKKKQIYGAAEENEEIKLSFVELEDFKRKTVYEIGDAKAEIALTRYLSKNF